MADEIKIDVSRVVRRSALQFRFLDGYSEEVALECGSELVYNFVRSSSALDWSICIGQLGAKRE